MARETRTEGWRDDLSSLDPLSFAIRRDREDAPRMVRQALEDGRTQIALLPVVSAADSGAVLHYECLVRLTDETGRVIPAAAFITDIEETDLGRALDRETLRLALAQLREMPDLNLSVNVSARSLADGAWRRVLQRDIALNGGFDDRLTLEVSETSAIQLHEVVVSFMEEMQPSGLCFALDRFGAGLTAFRHLKDFLFDLAKIDKSYVRGIEADADSQVVVGALIAVARQFDMAVIADGVETEAEAQVLRDLGVDYLQGFLFGLPRFMG